MNPGKTESTLRTTNVYTATNARLSVSSDGERWTKLGGNISSAIGAMAVSFIPAAQAQAEAAKAIEEAAYTAARLRLIGGWYSIPVHVDRVNYRLFEVICGSHSMRAMRYRRLQRYRKLVREKST